MTKLNPKKCQLMSDAVAAPLGDATSSNPVRRRLLPTLATIVVALLAGEIAANISSVSDNLHITLEQQISGQYASHLRSTGRINKLTKRNNGANCMTLSMVSGGPCK